MLQEHMIVNENLKMIFLKIYRTVLKEVFHKSFRSGEIDFLSHRYKSNGTTIFWDYNSNGPSLQLGYRDGNGFQIYDLRMEDQRVRVFYFGDHPDLETNKTLLLSKDSRLPQPDEILNLDPTDLEIRVKELAKTLKA